MKIEMQNKLLLGKILGEIYRLQNHMKMSCGAEESQIYGLLNGFEHVIEQECESIGFIEQAKLTHTMDVLSNIFDDPKKMAVFKGFYDIEDKLKEGDVDRSSAIRIITYLKANHQFLELIEKMNSMGSPAECKKFEIYAWDK